MCAEAVWWQCHRQLIADALVARGIEVRHITSAKAAAAHTLTSFARVERIAGDLSGSNMRDWSAQRWALASAFSLVSPTRMTERSGLPLPSRLTQAIQCGPRTSV